MGAMPALFLKLHFAWEIWFCVIIQGIGKFFGSSTSRILLGACILYGKTVTICLAQAMDIQISP